MKKHILFSLLFFMATPLVYSQTRTIKGTVVAFNKYPLKKVTVKSKKSKQLTTTDEAGLFEIEVNAKKDALIFEAEGFKKYQKNLVSSDNVVTINMIFANSDKNLEAAVEYGYISREDLTYGINHLDHENSSFSQFTDIYEAIRNNVPGVNIIHEDGKRQFQVRGSKSLMASNAALIVVNGIVTSDIGFLLHAFI